MALNIEDQRVHDLVKQIAGETGETQTSVVRRAVEEVHSRLHSQSDRADRILRDGRRVGSLLRRDAPDQDPTAFLYDDDGLSR